MVLTLYGHPLSPPAKQVALVLKEKGVPFEFVLVDLQNGEHKKPEFLAKNPFGLIPVIDDDGFVVYESRAIARYVAEKYADRGTKLLPTEFKSRVRFEQAASVEQQSYNNYVYQIQYERMYKKYLKLTTNEEVVEENLKRLNKTLDIYEQILGEQKYLAGDEITLVDLFHLPTSVNMESLFPDLFKSASRPNVQRWYSELVSRDSWKEVKDGLA